jgi:UDP-2,3-diacylglucosamine pyrophosphatase LpxH
MSRLRMHLKFDTIYRSASKPENRLPFVPENDRIVCFSDHHKGDGGVADDFRKNADLYSLALSHYEEKGFRLILLGDNDELWETHIDRILKTYRPTIAKEISMAPESRKGGRLRLWGNHDKEVILNRFSDRLARRGEAQFEGVEYRQGLCLGPDILLVHGHQGRFFEDQAWRVSRWAIKIIWTTIQRVFQIGMDGPAENTRIRESLERDYYRWAKKRRVLLICGHTHRAVFASLTHFDRIRLEIDRLRKAEEEHPSEENHRQLLKYERELRELLDQNHGRRPKPISVDPDGAVPCYFNDGCCGYTNGITCLELDRGWIRLAKWDREEKMRQVLAEDRLPQVIRHIKETQPQP